MTYSDRDVRIGHAVVDVLIHDATRLARADRRASLAARVPLVRKRGAGRPKASSVRSSARSGDSGDDGPAAPTSSRDERRSRA